MDRRHQPPHDPEALVQDLGHRRQAVGGAGGVGDDVVLLRVVGALVDPHDERSVHALAGDRQNHLFGARPNVRGKLVLLPEFPGRFENDVDPHLSPGKIGQVLRDVRHLDPAAADDQVTVVAGDLDAHFAVDGVVLEQMRQDLRFGPRIDGHDVDVVISHAGADQVPAHPAESVDCHLDAHDEPPCSIPRYLELLAGASGS